MLLAVSYHYISTEPKRSARAIFPAPLAAFEAQIEALARSFEFVSRRDLVAAVSRESSLPARGCLITFDDGLRSQFELALPVLERLGVPAIFFVSGLPLAERRPVHVHRIHALREKLRDEDLLEHLLARRPALDRELETISDETACAMYRYDVPSAARVKYLLNMRLDPPSGEQLIAEIFADQIGPDEPFCRDLYAGPDQVSDLERKHGAVGAHGYTHRPLALMDRAELSSDLQRGAAALAAVTGHTPEVISYPYGSADAVTTAVADAAAAGGFKVGLTMERALNQTLEDPMLLARLDFNEVPGGRDPQIHLGDGEVTAAGKVAARRGRYFEEQARAHADLAPDGA